MSTKNRERRVQFELRPAVYQALCRELTARGESLDDRGAMGRLINDILGQTLAPVVPTMRAATPSPAAAPSAPHTAQSQDDDDDGEWGFAKDKV